MVECTFDHLLPAGKVKKSTVRGGFNERVPSMLVARRETPNGYSVYELAHRSIITQGNEQFHRKSLRCLTLWNKYCTHMCMMNIERRKLRQSGRLSLP